jgi:hypothetical protein
MADFARWMTACETALWPSGTFWKAYADNRDLAVDEVTEADLVAVAVRDQLMKTRSEYRGSATELLRILTEIAGELATKSKSWPTDPRQITGCLRRAAPFLRKAGIEVLTGIREGHRRNRIIYIGSAANNSDISSSASSASSAPAEEPVGGNALAPPPERTTPKADDAPTSDKLQGGAEIVRTERRFSNAPTDADDADIEPSRESGAEKAAAIGWRAWV